jgi:hypothetical protein
MESWLAKTETGQRFFIFVIPAQAGIHSQPGEAAEQSMRGAGFPPSRE